MGLHSLIFDKNWPFAVHANRGKTPALWGRLCSSGQGRGSWAAQAPESALWWSERGSCSRMPVRQATYVEARHYFFYGTRGP